MLFEKIQICFNEIYYFVVHSVMNIMTADGLELRTKCHNNVFMLFLPITSWQRVITSTQ